MWPTDKHGVTSFTTIFPGFYVCPPPLTNQYSQLIYQIQRAIHIHAQVHTNWTIRSNGTLVHGPIVSTGQIFIDEKLEQEIMALEPYASHTEIKRVKNLDDGIYSTESNSTYLPVIEERCGKGVANVCSRGNDCSRYRAVGRR